MGIRTVSNSAPFEPETVVVAPGCLDGAFVSCCGSGSLPFVLIYTIPKNELNASSHTFANPNKHTVWILIVPEKKGVDGEHPRNVGRGRDQWSPATVASRLVSPIGFASSTTTCP